MWDNLIRCFWGSNAQWSAIKGILTLNFDQEPQEEKQTFLKQERDYYMINVYVNIYICSLY